MKTIASLLVVFFLPLALVAQQATVEAPSKVSFMGLLFGKREITVKAKVQGEITKMNFEEGQAIQENQVLAVVDDRQKKIERNLASVEYEMSLKDYQKSVKLEKFISKDELFLKEGAMIKKKSTFELKEVDLANTKITAPIAGVITKIYVDRGETVAIGDKVMEVIQLDELVLHANISAKESSRMKLGTVVKFKVSDLGDQIFEAQVSFVSPVIDPATETIRTKFTVKNLQNAQKAYILKPGMVAQVFL